MFFCGPISKVIVVNHRQGSDIMGLAAVGYMIVSSFRYSTLSQRQKVSDISLQDMRKNAYATSLDKYGGYCKLHDIK